MHLAIERSASMLFPDPEHQRPTVRVNAATVVHGSTRPVLAAIFLQVLAHPGGSLGQHLEDMPILPVLTVQACPHHTEDAIDPLDFAL